MSNINVNNLTPLLGSGSSVSVSGSLVVKNDVTIGGHLYIGDENTDSVTFSAEVSSSVIPDATVTYDLGSSAKKWRTMYLNSLVVHHITASGNISASGTGINGTGSFHHVTVNGDITASGTGSFQQGVIANQSSSFTYISMSGALKTAYHVSASKLQLTETAEIYGSASMGYISSSGDLTASGTGSFGGGIDSSTATGSFGQVTAVGDVSSSGTGSFMDLFVDDMVEIQGDVNLHGNISQSGTATASFGHISASGDISTSTNIHAVQYYTDSLIFATGDQGANVVKLGGGASVTQIHGLSIDVTGSISASSDMTIVGDISSSGRVSASGGFETDAGTTSNFGNISMSGALTLTGDVSASRVSASAGFEADSDSKSTFGHISMSGDLQIGNNTVVVSGSVGQITASGNISGGAQVFGGDYYAQGLQFATQADNQSSGVLQIGGSQPMRIKGTSLMVTGSVSMSGALSMSGANSDLTIDQGNIVISNGNISTTAGSISSSEHIIGNLIQQHTNGVTNFAVDALGQVTASGQISSSAGLAGTILTVATNGATKAAIDASGNIAAEGFISSSGDVAGRSLTLTSNGAHFASIDASGNIAAEGAISSSALVSATSLDIKSAGVTKATIDTSGNLDLIAGNEAGATGSFGYISMSGDFSASGNITASGVYADGDVSASGAVFTKFIKPNAGATLNITPDSGPAFASDTHTVQIYGGLRAGAAITTAHTILGPTTVASLVDLTPTLETQTANFTAAVGREYIVNKADGAAIVLPAAAIGARITILIGTLITSNTTTITAAAGDLLKGYAFLEATDAANNKTHFVPDGSDDLIITLDGSTTGGLIGDRIELVGISATEWRVRATLSHTGTAATPFS